MVSTTTLAKWFHGGSFRLLLRTGVFCTATTCILITIGTRSGIVPGAQAFSPINRSDLRGRQYVLVRTTTSRCPRLFNIYDDWRSDAIVVDTLPLDEETVQDCLEAFVQSEYGTTMFGCHDRAASIGVTGSIEFVDLSGPQVTLKLDGKFWHKRSFVLGRAAMWLNARIPEITDVLVADQDELQDFEEIIDEITGEVLFRKDKRSEDFNGDRATMEYQGMDPDMRGPFPQGGPMGGGSGGSMINPI
mmetsp:Transcript_12790/g.23885  ORF Transcript_12790/g.23885 Transcript_12790/m.23885 type:complete len:246 (+) Transcript_12790:30-767(+)